MHCTRPPPAGVLIFKSSGQARYPDEELEAGARSPTPPTPPTPPPMMLPTPPPRPSCALPPISPRGARPFRATNQPGLGRAAFSPQVVATPPPALEPPSSAHETRAASSPSSVDSENVVGIVEHAQVSDLQDAFEGDVGADVAV
jgi:hypothetical protein